MSTVNHNTSNPSNEQGTFSELWELSQIRDALSGNYMECKGLYENKSYLTKNESNFSERANQGTLFEMGCTQYKLAKTRSAVKIKRGYACLAVQWLFSLAKISGP